MALHFDFRFSFEIVRCELHRIFISSLWESNHSEQNGSMFANIILFLGLVLKKKLFLKYSTNCRDDAIGSSPTSPKVQTVENRKGENRTIVKM